jgi:oligogalacturonide transport system substrate-binding protein
MKSFWKIFCAVFILSFFATSFMMGADQKQITMRFLWWGGDVRHKATLAAIDLYQKKNPNVKIEAEYQGYEGYQAKLMIQIAGNIAPDIIQVDSNWLPDFAAMGTDIFVDLNKEKAVDLKQFNKTVLEKNCSIDKTLVGLPGGMNCFGLMINKTFFKKFNIPLNTEWTWDKIIEIGKKVHKQDKNSYLFCLDSYGIPLIFFNEVIRSKTGKMWVTDNGVINASKAEIADAFKMLVELYDSEAVVPIGESSMFSAKLEQYPKWLGNQLGMVQDWTSSLSKYKTTIKPENFAIAKNIQVKGGKDLTTPTKPSMLISVNKKSQNAAEAVKFLNWMNTDKEAIAALKDVRSTPGSEIARKILVAQNIIDPDVVKMSDWGNKAPAPYIFIMNSQGTIDIVYEISERVIYKKITPEKAADELISRMNDKIKEMKAAK